MNTEKKVQVAKVVAYSIGAVAAVYTAFAVGDFTYRIIANYLVENG